MIQKTCAEIETQVDELLQSGLVELFPPGEYPTYSSSIFLVAKKESKTRRTLGQYVKLYKRTKANAAFLPRMENLVEQMAKYKVK